MDKKGGGKKKRLERGRIKEKRMLALRFLVRISKVKMKKGFREAKKARFTYKICQLMTTSGAYI